MAHSSKGTGVPTKNILLRIPEDLYAVLYLHRDGRQVTPWVLDAIREKLERELEGCSDSD